MAQKQSAHGGSNKSGQEQFANALGWFSVGLGLAEIVVPKRLSRLIGVRYRPVLMRVMGAREFVSGVGILAQRRPAGWLWGRVAGDALDIAMLSRALSSSGTKKDKVSGALAAVAGVAVLDVRCARQLSCNARGDGKGDCSGTVHVRKTMAINRSPEDLYGFWRDIENLPKFMNHLESVRVTGDNRSHWIAKAPAGKTVEWDAEIITDLPNEAIAWRSVDGVSVPNSGLVRFERAPGGRGSQVAVELEYTPPGGMVGAAAAKLFGEEPEQQVREDLRRFKRLMENGEIATTEGQSSGRRSLLAKLAKSANPVGKEKQ